MEVLSFPFIWKSAQFGYDGTGVKVVRNEKDLKALPNVECIAEELVDFKNEIAVIVTRSSNGEVKTYPISRNGISPRSQSGRVCDLSSQITSNCF